jgi:hypothetical protein
MLATRQSCRRHEGSRHAGYVKLYASIPGGTFCRDEHDYNNGHELRLADFLRKELGQESDGNCYIDHARN